MARLKVSPIKSCQLRPKLVLELETNSGQIDYLLHIIDHYGFSQREPVNVFLKMQKDLPPVVNLDPLIDTSPVLLFETRKVSFRIKDDFGLKECSLICSIFRGDKKIKDLEIIRENFVFKNII